MKIALAVHAFDPQRDDASAWNAEFARRLARLGHEVHVVSQGFTKAGLALPIEAHAIGRVRSVIRRAAKAEAELRTLGADIVHDLGLTWYADLFSSHAGSPLAMQASRVAATGWLKRPVMRWRHRLLPSYRREAQLARRRLDNSGAEVVTWSEAAAADYQTFHGVGSDRCHVINKGVDIKRFAPHVRKLRRETTRRKLGINPTDLLLLFVGDDYARQGLHVTLQAVRRLVRMGKPIRLIVAGEDKAAGLDRQAARLGDQVVQFLGDVHDRLPYYAAADAFVLPARSEPSSQSVLEAAACGLPCITTKATGAAELLSDGRDGFILDSGRSRLLADRVAELFDGQRLQKMGQAARRTAMKYPFERCVDRIVEVYDSILARREADEPTVLTASHWRCDPAHAARRAA